MKRYIPVLLLLLGSLCFGQHEVSLQISAPANNAVVHPGQAITIMVIGAPSLTDVQVFAGRLLPQPQLVSGTRWQFSLPIPSNVSMGTYELSAIGIGNDNVTGESQPVTIDVEPASAVQSLASASPEVDIYQAGASAAIRVIATLADGTQADVSRSTATSYSSTDTTIATVSGQIVTGVAPGKTTINVTNGTAIVSVPVVVGQPQTTTAGFLPFAVATISPHPNPSGWNNANATVTVNSDETSIANKNDRVGAPGIKNTMIVLEGAQTGTSVVPGSTATATISNEGTTSVLFNALDNDGFQSKQAVIPIQLDKTPPTIAGTFAPAPNANGWNNSLVTVTFTCSDALSGLAAGSPPSPTLLSANGKNQQVAATCQDVASNVASATVSGINIDQTPPEAFNEFAPSLLDVSVFGSDDLSGVASGPLVPTSDVVASGGDRDADRDDRPRELRTFQFSDLAGNQTILTESIRKTSRSATASLLTIQYGTNSVTPLPRNREHFEWELNVDGSLKTFRQELRVDGEREHRAEAFFSGEDGRTVIHEEGFERREIVRAGLVLLEVVTQNGRLNIEF